MSAAIGIKRASYMILLDLVHPNHVSSQLLMSKPVRIFLVQSSASSNVRLLQEPNQVYVTGGSREENEHVSLVCEAHG